MANLVVIDLGYGYTKARMGDKIIEPFASCDGEAVFHSVNNDMLKSNGHFLTIKGNGRFYGHKAIEQSKHVRFLFARERTEQRDLMLALFYAALGEIGASGHVNVVTGLPLTWLDDKQALVNVLKGGHVFDFDGIPQSVHIDNVLVLPQALGAFFGQILDDNGKLCNRQLATGRVGVIDVGSYTTGYALADNLSYIAKHSGIETNALSTCWENIANVIQDKYNLNYAPHKIDDIIRDDQTITVKGAKVDITGIIDNAVDQLASDVVKGARALWGNAIDFDAILLVGGGARMILSEVQKVYPHARFVQDAHLANLQGFYAYGRRKFG